MKKAAISLPEIVSREEWLKKRKSLLIEEKEFTKEHEKINAKRRQLPMVEVKKEYIFEGSDGKESLLGLFPFLR